MEWDEEQGLLVMCAKTKKGNNRLCFDFKKNWRHLHTKFGAQFLKGTANILVIWYGKKASVSSEQRSVQAVTVIGVGGGKVNNLFIYQIFIDCLSKMGHCTKCQSLSGPHTKYGCPCSHSTPCVYLVCILPMGRILMCICGHVHSCMCVH